MKRKTRIVVLTTNNARIYTVPNAEKYKGVKDVLINPSFKKVMGIPPHHWKIKNNELVPMTGPERVLRDASLKVSKPQNTKLEDIPVASVYLKQRKNRRLKLAAVCGIISIGVTLWLLLA